MLLPLLAKLEDVMFLALQYDCHQHNLKCEWILMECAVWLGYDPRLIR